MVEGRNDGIILSVPKGAYGLSVERRAGSMEQTMPNVSDEGTTLSSTDLALIETTKGLFPPKVFSTFIDLCALAPIPVRHQPGVYLPIPFRHLLSHLDDEDPNLIFVMPVCREFEPAAYLYKPKVWELFGANQMETDPWLVLTEYMRRDGWVSPTREYFDDGSEHEPGYWWAEPEGRFAVATRPCPLSNC